MNKKDLHYQTFKKGSKTYFSSSLFFPEDIRREVFILYGFVRVADDLVDAVPQDREGLYALRARYENAAAGSTTGDPIVDEFAGLMKRKCFSPAWVTAFLDSMEMDLVKREYDTLDETLKYIYGSAEVIGLFMASILGLPEESHHAAKMLGRAMQYINFIRDIREDLELGRRYLPLAGSGLAKLDYGYVSEHRAEFCDFHRSQIDLYRGWHEEAREGYRYIPKRYLVPIKTAEDMYLWTAGVIARDPFIVYERKVKPGKTRIVLRLLRNMAAIKKEV